MQCMRKTTKQLNTQTLHRRRADKLSAAARRSSKIFGGSHKLTAARQAQGSSPNPTFSSIGQIFMHIIAMMTTLLIIIERLRSDVAVSLNRNQKVNRAKKYIFHV